MNPQSSVDFIVFRNKRLTNVQRNCFSITPYLHNIIIGLSLGDLNIHKQYTNAKLRFEQGLVHEAYVLHLYDLFKDGFLPFTS